MRRVGFEPTRIAPRELESRSLTARTSSQLLSEECARYGIRTHADCSTTTSTWPRNLLGNLAWDRFQESNNVNLLCGTLVGVAACSPYEPNYFSIFKLRFNFYNGPLRSALLFIPDFKEKFAFIGNRTRVKCLEGTHSTIEL